MTADPYATATALLAAFVAAWEGKALPKPQWVAEGATVAWDGEQVVVTVGPMRPGLPGQPIGTPRPPRIQPVSATFAVELVRSRGAGLQQGGSSQSALPTRAQNKTAGAAAGADLTAMLTTLRTIRENGSVVTHPTKLLIESVRPSGPDGDLIGAVGTVTILLGH